MASKGNNMSANEMVEALNKAVELQINAKLANASFDSTVEGVIAAEVDVDNGVYLVQIQNAKFEAYATTGKYYEGETVYITVPQGDYTKQKFITGRKTSDDEGTIAAFRFKYPFDDFIALSNLTSDSGTSLNKLTIERSWRANKPADGAEPNYTLTNINSDPNVVWHWSRNGKELLGTTLGIQMDVKSYLGQYNPISGDYGLRILVRGDEFQDDGQVQQNVAREFYFNTAGMYGNPYGFLDKSTQQCLIDVSRFNKIEEIAAYFWQDHDFIDDTGTRIPYLDSYDSSRECEPNIFLSDFSVGFGLQTKDIGNEDLRLYTYDSTSFGEKSTSTTPRAQLDTRTLRFGWVHKCPDDNYMMINSVETLRRFNEDWIEVEKKKAHIYWFHQIRSNEEVEGIPYVAPGTAITDLETQQNTLESRRQALINATNADMFSSSEAYDNYIANINAKYDKQIAAIQDMIDNSGDQTLQRISTMGGIDYRYLPEFTDQFSMTYQMDINQFRERFKVVVAWDNTYEVSEPLEFKNVDTAVLENLAERKNEIVFRMLRTQTYKENNQTKTRLIEENSLGNFYVYDENNQCIQNEEETFWSDMWFYIQLWIWDEEFETYVPLTTTSTADPVTVEWEFPSNNTMIRYVSQLNQNDITTFGNSLLPIQNNFDGVQASTRKFQIDDYWDMRKHNNIIRATVNRNGKQYNVSKMLYFGQSGTMGSKYTLRIDLTEPQTGYAIVAEQGFTLSASVYSQEGEKLESSAFQFTYELLNPTACVLTYTQQYPGPVNISGSGYNRSGYKAVLKPNAQNRYLPPLFKVTVDLKDPEYKYDISNVKGFMSVSAAIGPTRYDVGCPDRVEYKSDGQVPVYDSSVFTVRNVSSGELEYPTWQFEQWRGTTRLTSGYKYLSLETQTIYSPQINTKEFTTPSNTGQKTYTAYKLNPYIENGHKKDKVAFFWEDEMESNYPTFIGFTFPEQNGYTFWQAIAFAHNVYSSSLVNNWDGQLTIDKEKNAILTRMLSAGVKDTKNRFTGVLLGDWSTQGDTSIDPIGLYGFNTGEQTFGFKTDGSGFIGKAGYGQIIFDGEYALITDRTKDHYINLNPVKYKVENGAVVLDESRNSYSQYFLYAKNTKLDTTNPDPQEAGSGGTTSSDNDDNEANKYLTANNTKRAEYGYLNTKWADTFTNDTTHDYFVVDPNNGVYMSGGLIAKYGKIGDCLELSSAGLTYSKNNGIIFIGEERTRDGKVITSTHTTNGYDNLYWSSQKGDKYNFRNGTRPSTSWGRYVIWIGDANDKGVPKYLYPNFGIEHNGIVHLNKAFVQGEIHASSLQIGMDDGEYHDARSRFARTYYSDYNPANITSNNGVCDKVYGDILLAGDLWYDTNVTVNIKDISSFSITPKKDANGDEVQLDTSNPAKEDTNSSYPYGFDVSQLSEKASRGYVCYEWIGHQDNVNDYPECTWTYQKLNETTGKMETVTETIQNHKGWRRLPVLSKDTLTEVSMLALQSTNAIQTLQTKLTSALKTAYKNIRTGMSPISFFEDGNCYVSIAHKQSTVSKIGTVPPGISIYQVDNNGYPNGAYFLLNGQRMGFYKKYTVNGTTIDVPMLTYYQGNMGLAGSLVFGLNMTKISTQDTDQQDFSAYQNYLDGPNAKFSLGDGSIVLDSDIKNISKTSWEPKITLGSLGGKAKITLAGWDIKGVTNESAQVRLGFKAPTSGSDVTDTRTYVTFSKESGTQLGTETKNNTFGFTYTTYAITYEDDTVVQNETEVSSLKTKKVLGLNKFHILHQDRGITLYEKNGKYTVDNAEAGDAHNFVILTPTAASSHQTLLIGWDIIQGDQGNFKQLSADSIFCKYIYVRNGTNNTAHKLATEKWVLDKLYDVYHTLCNKISDAQSTANQAYGTASNHRHEKDSQTSDRYSWC